MQVERYIKSLPRRQKEEIIAEPALLSTYFQERCSRLSEEHELPEKDKDICL